jgi:N-acetylglutamate synthase-like GNAT family acetyltransferase
MYNYRQANINDLNAIINLLSEDDLGQAIESLSQEFDQKYIDAFHKINADQNQYLMIVESDKEIIGTCHLTIMPSLTFIGSTRMQIEAVRVLQKYRGSGIGKWMINAAIEYGRSNGASIIQLTTNKKRSRAKSFYESIGFEANHEGMKMYLGEK